MTKRAPLVPTDRYVVRETPISEPCSQSSPFLSRDRTSPSQSDLLNTPKLGKLRTRQHAIMTVESSNGESHFGRFAAALMISDPLPSQTIAFSASLQIRSTVV
jgi:hypothetical protein